MQPNGGGDSNNSDKIRQTNPEILNWYCQKSSIKYQNVALRLTHELRRF